MKFKWSWFIQQQAERSGILLRNAHHYDAVVKGNPAGKKLARALCDLARDTHLPTLPTLQEATYGHMAALAGLPPSQALHLLDCLHKSLLLPGTVCEMGVAQGCTTRLLAQELLSSSKSLWLFDSFQGLPAPTSEDKMIHDIFGLGAMSAYEGKMCCPRDLVEAKLQEIGFPQDRCNIVAGFFDDTTPRTKQLPHQVCFAFVDFDLYKPIKDALHWLDTALVVGGHVIVHDYGFFSSGAQQAVDEFVAGNASQFRMLPPHRLAQGIAILQRVATA